MGARRDLDVVVVGSVNQDFLARGPRLPAAGETLAGVSFQEAPGGKGANQAVAAARAGARVALVARVGAEGRGEELVAHLRREGVDTGRVIRDGDAPTGAAVIHVDERGRKSILAVPGANARLSAEDVEAAAVVIHRSAVVLAQLEIPVPSVEAAFRVARAAGVQTVLDPAPGQELPERLLELVDVVRPNAREAEALTGIPVRDRRSAVQAARILLRRGVGAAAIAAGDDGTLLLARGEELWLPRLRVETVDETGAGDAFCGVFAAALAGGRSLVDAASLANAAAALATTRFGAQAGLPTREELQQFASAAPPPDELILDGVAAPDA